MKFMKVEKNTIINADNICFIELRHYSVIIYFNCDRKLALNFENLEQAKMRFDALIAYDKVMNNA